MANVDLIAGQKNIITLTVTGGCGNFDYLKLVSPVKLSQAEGGFTPDTPVEGDTFVFEGEDAARTSGSMGEMSVNNEAGASGGKALGNANNNNGATLTFSLTAQQDCTVSLYTALGLGSQTVENIFTLEVNGERIMIPSAFTAAGTANWATFEDYFLANINLKAGETTAVVITITGGCGNFDCLKVTAPCAVTAAPTV